MFVLYALNHMYIYYMDMRVSAAVGKEAAALDGADKFTSNLMQLMRVVCYYRYHKEYI